MPRSNMRSFKVLPFLALHVGRLVLGQSIVPIPDNVISDVISRVDNGLNPSIAIAAYDGGSVDAFVYGLQNVSSGAAASVDTIYDYGSVTKTFAALLLAKRFVQQQVNIWDPVDKFLPPDLGLRQVDGTPIELVHLATHTSGMPRMPENYDSNHPGTATAEYDRDMLYEYLRTYTPVDVGLNYSYSNTAFGVLGDALELATGDGRGFRQLVEEEVIAPLGLDIAYHLNTPEDEANYAQGYEIAPSFEGFEPWPAPYMDFQDALAGSAGLRGTIMDMLNWGVLHLPNSQISDPVLDEAVRFVTQRFYSGAVMDQALAWEFIHHDSGPVLRKDGQVGGFICELILDAANDRAAAVVTNSGIFSANDLAEMLIPFQ